jgi:DNA-binding transcriptional ArsR family regulator
MARPAIATDVFRAVADPTRRAMLDRLREQELPPLALAADFDLSLPGISQHLRVLREARLVVHRQVGRQRLYRLTPEPLLEVADWISHYTVFWRGRLSALRKHLDENP